MDAFTLDDDQYRYYLWCEVKFFSYNTKELVLTNNISSDGHHLMVLWPSLRRFMAINMKNHAHHFNCHCLFPTKFITVAEYSIKVNEINYFNLFLNIAV
jgi:hypothetical protein